MTRGDVERLAIGVVCSALGFGVHNAVELGPRDGLLAWQNGFLLLLGGQLLLLAVAVRRPRAAAGWLLASALLQLAGGAVLSVLPLPFLPYAPEQTPAHYAMHALYGVAQLPLLHAAWRTLRRT